MSRLTTPQGSRGIGSQFADVWVETSAGWWLFAFHAAPFAQQAGGPPPLLDPLGMRVGFFSHVGAGSSVLDRRGEVPAR
ncbi:hypothetical protein [Leucobacter sp. W1038]|uniref:hypothetical protein n=1 Tax=Leucobacter sp. W1038 TaxID=3438281 RepID=UPI003D96D42F